MAQIPTWYSLVLTGHARQKALEDKRAAKPKAKKEGLVAALVQHQGKKNCLERHYWEHRKRKNSTVYKEHRTNKNKKRIRCRVPGRWGEHWMRIGWWGSVGLWALWAPNQMNCRRMITWIMKFLKFRFMNVKSMSTKAKRTRWQSGTRRYTSSNLNKIRVLNGTKHFY